MVKFLLVLALIGALLIGGLYYTVYLPQETALSAAGQETSRLSQESDALRQQIDDRDAMLSELRESSAELQVQLRVRETELMIVRSAQEDLVGALQQEIAAGQISIQRLQDNLRVNLVNEILFNSGETTLNAAGADVLRRVGEILSGVADRQIVVQGHTDNVPIGGRLAQRFATNWELSSARAVNVARFLQEEVDVDPSRLSAVGFSEYRPRAGNGSVEGRQQNRRIEIVLSPIPETSP